MLTPSITEVPRRYEPVLVRLPLPADTPAVAWHVAAMFDALSRTPEAWRNPKARPARPKERAHPPPSSDDPPARPC